MSKKRKNRSDGSNTTAPPPAVEASPADAPPPVVEKPVVETEVIATVAGETPAPAEASATPPPSSEVAVSTAPSPRKRRKKKAASERTSELPSTVREGKGSASEIKVAPEVLDKKLDRLEQKLEEKIDARAAARKGLASEPGVEEDSSIPPVVDEEEFFAASEKPKPAGASGSFDMVDPRQALKMTAEAHARRAHLTKYVKAAVAISAALCVAAFIRVKVMQHQVEPSKPAAAAAQVVTEVKAPDQATQVEAYDPDWPTHDNAPVTAGDGRAPDPTADSELGKDAAVNTSPVGVTGDATPKPKTAWQEKATAKAALESGSNGTAVAAGERSIALDPTDGETWLVLGGAYQAQGNLAQAKRCFNACIQQGKKGPIEECRQMLAQ